MPYSTPSPMAQMRSSARSLTKFLTARFPYLRPKTPPYYIFIASVPLSLISVLTAVIGGVLGSLAFFVISLLLVMVFAGTAISTLVIERGSSGSIWYRVTNFQKVSGAPRSYVDEWYKAVNYDMGMLGEIIDDLFEPHRMTPALSGYARKTRKKVIGVSEGNRAAAMLLLMIGCEPDAILSWDDMDMGAVLRCLKAGVPVDSLRNFVQNDIDPQMAHSMLSTWD